MILASWNSGRFEFVVIAESKQAAKKALRSAWRTHVRQSPYAEPRLYDEALTVGDVNFIEIEIGVPLRDGSPLEVIE